VSVCDLSDLSSGADTGGDKVESLCRVGVGILASGNICLFRLFPEGAVVEFFNINCF